MLVEPNPPYPDDRTWAYFFGCRNRGFCSLIGGLGGLSLRLVSGSNDFSFGKFFLDDDLLLSVTYPVCSDDGAFSFLFLKMVLFLSRASFTKSFFSLCIYLQISDEEELAENKHSMINVTHLTLASSIDTIDLVLGTGFLSVASWSVEAVSVLAGPETKLGDANEPG